jgi:hypothetical protein
VTTVWLIPRSIYDDLLATKKTLLVLLWVGCVDVSSLWMSIL